MNSLRAKLLILKSSLKGNSLVRNLGAALHGVRALMTSAQSPAGTVARINHLCAAVRLLPEGRLARRLETSLIKARDKAGFSREQWTAALTRPASPPVPLPKSVILKPWVSEREPGVLFISFEHQWAQLLRLPELEQMARDYTLVVSPTWSPPHTPLNVVFPTLWPAPVHCLISHEDDLETLPRLSSNYRMIPLLASSWVDEQSLAPRPDEERDIDLVMVANFAPFKRHVLFFQALRELPQGLRILLIGQRDGNRDEHSVLREAEVLGVRDRFELHTSMPHGEVLKTLARARASVVLSRREGSCVVVAESLFADTPVGLVQGAHIGSAKFIQPETGLFMREDRLAEDMMTLIHARKKGLRPREWALRHSIGARGSSVILNEHLKSAALATGAEWTRDISPMKWCPAPRRIESQDDASWAEREYLKIENHHGIQIGMHPPNQKCRR